MIVAIGVDVDDTFSRFVRRAMDAGVDVCAVNLRAAVEGEWLFEVPAREPASLRYCGETVRLNPCDAFYCRMIDLSSRVPDPVMVVRWRALLAGLRGWLESVPGKVVNPVNGAAHNSSKPLHESVLRDLGFKVPESITSSDREKLLEFVREAPAVSKAVCGVRADTAVVEASDLESFDPQSGPVHLQRLITGDDARIHVVGMRLVAQRVSASSVDYRRSGGLGEMEVFDCPKEVAALLVEATRSIGLVLAGWDFKIDNEGQFWCLEANPMPGYSPYDARCDGAITRELIAYLEGQAPNS
jgi:hypothetical protein